MSQFTQYNKSNTDGKTHELLCGIEDQFGFLPNMFTFMIESPVAVQAYLQLNQLTQQCSLTNTEKQLAMLVVSLENKCSYCSTHHRFNAIKSGISPQTIDALFDNQNIDNPKDEALISMMQSLVKKRGFIDKSEIDAFIAAGFTKKQLFECILIVTLKTLSNYTNHITQPQVKSDMKQMLN